MQVINFSDVKGEEFPAGRLTKILVGANSNLKADNFIMGQVTIYPGGVVPIHSHPEEEVYLILSGEGQMTVAGETQRLAAQSVVYIPSNKEHTLVNNGDKNLVMIFTYAPANIVEHWEEERQGMLK